jgi:hypothetical protein
MESDVKSQVRITAWPAAPLPLPEAVKVESRLDLEEGVIVPCARPGVSGNAYDEERAPLSGETYLRLAEVDLDDPNAIFDFTARYGILGGRDAYRALMANEEDYFFKNFYEARLDSDQEYEKKKRALWKEAKRVNPDLYTDAQLEQLDEWESLPGGLALELAFGPIETLDEFCFAARCLRDLTSAWQMWRDGLAVTDFKWVSPSKPEGWPWSERTAVGVGDAPTQLLAHMLTCFLRSFSPQLSFEWSTSLATKDLAAGINAEPRRGPEYAPLYAICALELFNHIIENAEYHICANERCLRTFVHQQGRAEKGPHRSSGVKYCSPSCARATAQREYRRRRRTS